MSLSQEYDSILEIYLGKVEHTSLRQDSSEYQALLASLIERLLRLKTTIHTTLALFSANESIEDIPTSSIKFLGIDYYLAQMCSRKQTTSAQISDPLQRNKMKLKFLDKSVQLFMQFIHSLQDVEILDQFLVKKIESFENSYRPTLQEFSAQPAHKDDLSGAQLKRQQKIESYRQAKQTAELLDSLEDKYKQKDETQDDDKDELLRELSLQRLKHLSYSAINAVEQILYEIELLTNFTKISPPPAEPSQQKGQKQEQNGFTDKLETLNRPLLSKEGKVLRNFTLVDKRTELQSKVRGYGQYGPTMSVEEFLAKEWEEGRVLQGGEPEPKDDGNEDSEKWQDEQTYKARYWDEFKEANPKGSGNTINRG
ncbi:hypothetical protein HG536_0G01050 [Torulaspora globosa]|uniref:TAP42-like protein n=1 Tax=Torulaspora globosa TaxID=48254 RepID=A0A7G3ZL62_9SACH|nr:uncharacterized protein HG536_0G01050 [Torulaspora globosa]QLL34248.1 hypothetical protein HG536_0G01050 [Torulaspora globosa]